MARTSTPPTLQTVEELLAKADAKAAGQLDQLANSAEKDVRKAAKRALFLLKQKGVEPPAAKAAATEASGPRQLASRAWTGLTGPEGLRTVMFEVPDNYGGASTSVLFTLHDRTGVRDVQVDKVSPRDLDGFDAQEQTPMRFRCQMPVPDARAVIEHAVQMSHKTKTMLPKGFGEANAKLGDPMGDTAIPNPESLWDSEALIADLSIPRDPDTVMQRPGMMGWLVPMRFCRPWAVKFLEAYNSPLELSDAQLRDRGEAVIKEACDTLFKGAMEEVQSRLWTNANIYQLGGDEESAKMLAVQAALVKPDAEPSACGLVLASTRNGVHLAVLEITKRMEMEAGGEDAVEP